ncbi:MAG: hypothetical protein ACK5LR_03290 [Mangrovibacterium sp.]
MRKFFLFLAATTLLLASVSCRSSCNCPAYAHHPQQEQSAPVLNDSDAIAGDLASK